MILFILLHNRQGKTRLSKWYIPMVQGEEEKSKIEVDVYRLVVRFMLIFYMCECRGDRFTDLLLCGVK